jgi:hypothetical protein
MPRRAKAAADVPLGEPGESLWERLARTAKGVLEPAPEAAEELTDVCEKSLYAFVKEAWHTVEPSTPFVDGWHLGCVSEHLQALSELQIQNLIVNEPPRHTKSRLACVFWPGWGWVREPHTKWLFATYGDNLARRDAEDTLELVTSPWYRARWGHLFKVRSTASEKIKNDRQGYRIAATVAGKIMGEGGDYLVFDDPIKPQDVLFKSKRDAVINTWSKAMTTRANDLRRSRRLVLMQRLHENDLSGYLMRERTGYETLILPLEYEPKRYFLPEPGRAFDPREVRKKADTILPTTLQRRRPELLDPRKEEGELLWPERYGPKEVESLKNELEAVGTAGQLQQRPAPAEGELFKAEFFRHFFVEADTSGRLWAVLGVREKPDDPEPLRLCVADCRFLQTIDTAMTLNAKSAYTAVMTLAWHRPTGNLLVWHVWRQRLEVHEQLPAILELRDGLGEWDPRVRQWVVPGKLNPWPSRVVVACVENKASGIGILQEAALRAKPLTALSGHQNPILRAAAAVNMMRNKRIWLRAGGKWVPDLEDELRTFPSGQFADQATCLSYLAMQAGSDALLNAQVEGELLVHPAVPTDRDGRQLDPREWTGNPGSVQVLNVGRGIEVVFNDEEGWD